MLRYLIILIFFSFFSFANILTFTYNNAYNTLSETNAGRTLTSTEQNANTTTYEYDAVGNQIKMIDALGNETSFIYDSQGNKLSQKDAKDRTTQWAYDKYGREISRTLPLGQSESITYDAFGKIATKTDFNNQTTSYIYDSNDRIQSITYADKQKEEFVYNALGQTTQTTMTIGTDTFITSYSYHKTLGRLTKEIQPNGTILEYEYDSVGNLLTFTLTNANNEVSSTQYQYDTLNRLKTVISPQGEPTNYSYDDLGNLKTLTHANGNQEIYTYDTLNRLTSLIHQDANENTLASFAYTLSPLGERVEITEDKRSTSYSYDALSRVISEEISDAKNGDYSSSYTYDEVSNTIASTIDGVTTQYDYDDNDRLLQQGGTVYTYDNQGNTLSQTLDYNSTNYSYNAKNQLIEVVTDSDTINYSYNIKGIRTAKSKTEQNTQYIIDSNQAYAQVVQEIEDDSLTVSYTYGHDLLSQTRQNKTYDYHYDGLGSARYLSDQNGTFTDSYNYEAFGKLLNTEGNTTNNYKFTGEQLDEETQNYYLRSRYFSPLRGGFTQQDSYMGNSQDPITLHKYLYGNGNPVSNIDPSGYFSMMSVSGAMGIANTLRNGQIEAYSHFMNVITGGWDGVSLDDVPAILGTAVGVGLVLRFLKKGCNSFDGTTLVATENGLVPIEEIKIGDKVWAYNENNQSKSLQGVTHLIRGEGDKALVDITLSDGKIITATSNHPFWEIDTQKWLEAEELILSSVLLNINDENSTIKSLKHYSDKKKVYNLTIGNIHTYYVGSEGVLGHNNTKCKYAKLDPRKIKFTQNSIKNEFQNGKGNLRETISRLRRGAISPDDFPPIRILVYNGQLWSLDNRRLYVFQQARKKIKTELVFMKDVKKEFKRKYHPINGGHTIKVRGLK